MQRPYQPAGQRDHELNDRIASRHPNRVNPHPQNQQADKQRAENVKKKAGDIDQQHAGVAMEVN